MKIAKQMLTVLAMMWYLTSPLSAFEGEFNDGFYIGQHSFVVVEVEIRDGEVRSISMLEHGGGGQEYRDMINPLMGIILAEQTTDVEAVSGATVSSENLIKAVEDALEKARE